MKKRQGWLLVLLMAAVLCCALAGTALAADTGSLTVQLGHERLGNDASGFRIDVYRIGTSNNGAARLNPAFANTGVLTAATGEQMEAALAQVSAIVDQTGLQPARDGVTGANGQLVFSGLPTGVYFGRMAAADGYTMTPFSFAIPMMQNGNITNDVTVNPKLQYQATGSIALRAFKELEGRDLQAREFTFSLRTAGNQIMQRVQNDQRGNVVFSTLNYTLSGDELTTQLVQGTTVLYSTTLRLQGGVLNNQALRYLIQEEAGEDAAIVYDDNVYTVEVRLTDNGRGAITVRDNQGRNARIFRNTVRGEEEKEPHKLTIYYKYLLTGETAFPTYTETLWEGDPYNVPSPDLPGYFVTLKVVSGVMPNHDMEYTVYYFPLKERQRLFNIDDLETPLGLGDIQIHVGVCYE